MLFRTQSRFRCMLLLYAGVALTLLLVYSIYKPPVLLISYFQWRYKDVLWRVRTTKKLIALTIDDGPSAYTAEILSVLKENDATATFFIIGAQVPGKEGLLQAIIKNGSELANHAMHDEPSRALPTAELLSQIKTLESVFDAAYAAVNVPPPAQRFFRPGSGFFSTDMRSAAAQIGYRVVLGDVYPHDPQVPYSGVNARHVLSMVRPGSIVICHDRRAWTVPMLRIVLPELRRRGYVVGTLSRLLEEEEG